MVTFYLARHGETEENAQHLLQGHIGGHLTALGREQANSLGKQLQGFTFHELISSDLTRAVDTAKIINEYLSLPLQTSNMLRERDWGELTGTRMDLAQKLVVLPSSVESVADTLSRASRWAQSILDLHDGKTFLIVSHGFFLRCLQAACLGVSFRAVPLMQNAEYRVLKVDNIPPLVLTDQNSTVISAN